jgi:hypothetical protein
MNRRRDSVADATAASALARVLHHPDRAFVRTGSPLGLLDARGSLRLVTDAVHLDDVLCLALTCRALRDALWARFPPRPAAARPHPGKRLLTHIRAMLATPSRRSWGRDYLDRIHPNQLSLDEHTNEPIRTQWAEAAAQAVRCAGLQLAGVPASWNWPTSAAHLMGAAGVYIVDEAAPAANGFPHYTNCMGWHLYHGGEAAVNHVTPTGGDDSAGEWHLRESFPIDGSEEPEEGEERFFPIFPVAYIQAYGALPAGNHVWTDVSEDRTEHDGHDLTLKVTELSVKEVAEGAAAVATRVVAERATAGAQSTRCAGLRVTAEFMCCGDGVYVLHPTTPEHDGFPYYVNNRGFSLFHSKRGLWHLTTTQDVDIEKHLIADEAGTVFVAAAHIIASQGEVPVGQHAWMATIFAMANEEDSSGVPGVPGSSARLLTVTELSAEEVAAMAAAERAAAVGQSTRCAGGIAITRLPASSAVFNATYARTGKLIDGYPAYAAGPNMHLFHDPSDDTWTLSASPFNPAKPGGASSFAYIPSAGGILPTGPRAWNVHDGAEWVDGEVTARELDVATAAALEAERAAMVAACLAAEAAVCAAQQATDRVVLRRLRGVPADPPVVAADHTVTFGGDRNFVTVGAPQLLSAGKAFFEVELLELPQRGCYSQLGWASAAFATSADYTNEGIGDCVHSWGVDGARSLKWHGVQTAFDTKWATGDLLGFAADPKAGRLLFAHNGEWRVVFEGVCPASGLHPAMSGQRLRLRANFGDRGWAHGPPDASYTAAGPWCAIPLLAQLTE